MDKLAQLLSLQPFLHLTSTDNCLYVFIEIRLNNNKKKKNKHEFKKKNILVNLNCFFLNHYCHAQ